MNNLMNNNVLVISSREVAEMMEVRHDNLMTKIKNISKDFTKYNENVEISTDLKIKECEFWFESKYQAEENGRWYDEYQVTKKGCEYLAMKGTGFKNNIFTAKYMKKFEEMEQELNRLQVPSYQIDNPIERAKKWIEEESIRQEQQKQLQEQAPKIEYYNKMLNSENTLTTTQIAKSIGMSAVKLNSILSGLKIQYKQGDQWFLYAQYQGKGYTKDSAFYQEDNNKAYHNTKWTEKGKEFIINTLQEYKII